MKEPPQTDL